MVYYIHTCKFIGSFKLPNIVTVTDEKLITFMKTKPLSLEEIQKILELNYNVDRVCMLEIEPQEIKD